MKAAPEWAEVMQEASVALEEAIAWLDLTDAALVDATGPIETAYWESRRTRDRLRVRIRTDVFAVLAAMNREHPQGCTNEEWLDLKVQRTDEERARARARGEE